MIISCKKLFEDTCIPLLPSPIDMCISILSSPTNTCIPMWPSPFHIVLLSFIVSLTIQRFWIVAHRAYFLCFVWNGDPNSPFSHVSKLSPFNGSLISTYKHFNILQFHFTFLFHFSLWDQSNRSHNYSYLQLENGDSDFTNFLLLI